MKSWCFVIGLLAFLIAIAQAQRRPPNYSQDDMPDTDFDCRDKILGGYYADLETDCQMFHVCVKVPGLGVQDFRFLCPNDTAFDQENQICANWFDIDCEAGTLFYSDNFDLYRIGQGPSKAPAFASSATPIPLGPSTARPPLLPSAAPRQRARNQYRQSDDEEDYFLQRSETGDRRLQQKDLRGSSSGNFFSKNKGKEDDYETDIYQPRKPTKSSTTTNTITPNATEDPSRGGKKKVAVRKLRKRPQQQDYFSANQYEDKIDSTVSTTAKSTTTYIQENYREQQNSNKNYYNTESTAAPLNYDTQSANKVQQNNNYYTLASTQAPRSYETPSTFNRNYYQSSTVNPSTSASSNNNYTPRYNTIQRTSSTFAPSTAANYNQQSTNYQNYNRQNNQQSTNYQNYNRQNNQQANYQQNNQQTNYQSYNNQQTKYNNQQTVNYQNNNNNNSNNFYNPNNNFAQKSTTLNAIEYSSTPASSSKAENYKNYQTPQRKDYPTSTTFAPAYSQSQQKNNYNAGTAGISTNNYQTTVNYKSSQRNDFDNYSTSNQRGNANYDYTTVQPDRYSNEGTNYNTRNNNDNNNNFYSSKFANSAYQSSTTIRPTTYNNNYKQTSSEEQNNYYKNENYDYQKTGANSQVNSNNNYQDESDITQGESLKTAPSNNYRPNSFNTFQTTYDKKDNSNSYNNNNNNNTNNYYYSNVTPKASTYSSAAVNSVYSSKQTTIKNNYDSFSQTTATPYKSSPSSTYYYTSTTKRPQIQTQSQVSQTVNKNPSTVTANKSTSTTNYQQPIYKTVTATFAPASDVSKTAGSKRPAAVTKTSTADPKDASYDYAYYDDAFVEYDGVDPIKDHHFGKTREVQKVPRSTKQ